MYSEAVLAKLLVGLVLAAGGLDVLDDERHDLVQVLAQSVAHRGAAGRSVRTPHACVTHQNEKKKKIYIFLDGGEIEVRETNIHSGRDEGSSNT